MPIQTAIILAGVVLAFAAFAISLAWVDSTREISGRREAPNMKNLFISSRGARDPCVGFLT
jgi:hypothetical protein